MKKDKHRITSYFVHRLSFYGSTLNPILNTTLDKPNFTPTSYFTYLRTLDNSNVHFSKLVVIDCKKPIQRKMRWHNLFLFNNTSRIFVFTFNLSTYLTYNH